MIRQIVMEEIDKSYPWEYFDGVAQGDPTNCGGGKVLHISDSHFFQIKYGLGSDTNNYAEIMALKILLLFALKKGYENYKFFGNSMWS